MTDLDKQNRNTAAWLEKVPMQQEQLASTKKQADENTVAGLVKRSNRILASIFTHKLPFDFFPDTINVEEGRLTVITRQFTTSQVHSVDIKDISNIFINMTPFYAQLVVVSRTFTKSQIEINGLRKKEAVFVRRLIEGLRIFVSKQIDTSNYTKEELVAKLEELSTTEIET
jgi:hypothetical protein